MSKNRAEIRRLAKEARNFHKKKGVRVPFQAKPPKYKNTGND